MSLIKTDEITLSYENMTVIDRMCFEVNAGDYLCVVGANGSGKSTLIKALLSLKKPVGGSISFGDGLKRNEIGYLPQQTSAQKDFPASVGEVVTSGCLNRTGLRPFFNAKDKALAMENMMKLGIWELRRRSYRELSGGQQQRVLLARALCATKKLLLLDEPVSGLDPMVTAELYSIISGINKSGVTVVMVTHDLAAAMQYASHILCLQRNGKWFYGTKQQFLQSEAAAFMRGGEQDV